MILPRNAVGDISEKTEISSMSVQGKRNQVFLGDGTRCHPPKQIHDCVNFFFNPFNTTVRAFARNQLLLGGELLQLAILEIPISRISDVLSRKGGLWACSKWNVAARGYTSSEAKDILSGWPWHEIFDCSGNRQSHSFRAAEFLLWIQGGNGLCSSGLPIKTISRILFPYQLSKKELMEVPHISISTFPSFDDLLRAEQRMMKFDQNSILGIHQASRTFAKASLVLPVNVTPDAFVKPDFARSNLHGIPHIIRVMFWVHYLTRPELLQTILPRYAADPFLADDSLLAAAIHDLGRLDDKEEPDHGQNSTLRFRETIRKFCRYDKVRAARIESAVTWHCRSDNQCPNPANPIFNVLKDADALDRGRFSGPCGGIDFGGANCTVPNCRHSGCAYRTLRLDYNAIPSASPEWPFVKRLAFAAWNLASATGTAPWSSDHPAEFLVKWICAGRNLVSWQCGKDGIPL